MGLATAAELAALPGLNDALAKNLVARRPFANMVAVNAVLSPSLTREQLTQLYGRLSSFPST